MQVKKLRRLRGLRPPNTWGRKQICVYVCFIPKPSSHPPPPAPSPDCQVGFEVGWARVSCPQDVSFNLVWGSRKEQESDGRGGGGEGRWGVGPGAGRPCRRGLLVSANSRCVYSSTYRTPGLCWHLTRVLSFTPSMTWAVALPQLVSGGVGTTARSARTEAKGSLPHPRWRFCCPNVSLAV